MVKRASGGDASWLAPQAEAPSNQQEITEEAQETLKEDGASSEHASPKNCCVEFFIMRVVRDSADSPTKICGALLAHLLFAVVSTISVAMSRYR